MEKPLPSPQSTAHRPSVANTAERTPATLAEAQTLLASQELLQATLDSSLDLIQVFEAVRDEAGDIVDFTWQLNNQASVKVYGNVIGQRLLARNPGVVEAGIFDTFKQVVETGQPAQREHHYISEQFNGWFHQSTVKLRDGVATTTANITARKEAEQEILRLRDELAQHATERYQTFFGVIDQGFCTLEVRYDAPGRAVDFRFLEVSASFAQHTGVRDAAGRWMREIDPGHEDFWFEAYGRVAKTRQSERFENFSASMGRWWSVYAFPIDEPSLHRVGVVFDDTTARKQQEQRQEFLLQLGDALRSLADAREIQRTATRVLGEYFGLDRALYAEITPDGETVVVQDNYLSGKFPAFTGAFPLAAYGPIIEKTRHGKPLVVPDVAAEPDLTEEEKANYQVIGSTAFVSLPLLKGGHWVASLVVHQGAPRRWTLGEVALLQETAERTWAAVERARAEDALRQSEQRTRIQKEAFQSAINGEPLARSLATLARMAKEQVGREVRTVFYLAYPDRQRLHAIDGASDLPDTYTRPVDGFRVGTESFCSGLAIATGQPALTPDVQADPKWHSFLPLAAAHGIRACNSYPILTREGRAVGSLALYFPDVHEPTPTEFAVAEAITQAAAIILARHTEAVERAQAEEALRQSEEKFRSLFQRMREGFAVSELIRDEQGQAVDYRFLMLNRAYERLAGLSVESSIGRTAKEMYPDLGDWGVDIYAGVVASGEPLRFEHYSEGLGRWHSVLAFALGGDRYGILYDDITERKQHEQLQAFLLRFSDAIRSLSHPLEVQQVGMRLLGEHLHNTRAFYFLTEPGEAGDWIHIIDTDYRHDPDLPSHAGRHSVRNFGLALFEGADRGKVVAVEDVRQVPLLTPAEVQQYLDVQVVSFINVPLLKDGRFVAGIGAHYAEPHPWTPATITLIQEVAERTWAAVERARAETALRESEEKYRSLFESIDEGYSLIELLYDEQGQAIDFCNLEVNPAQEKMTGQVGATGRTARELLPAPDAQAWVALLDQVARTGEGQRFERYVPGLDAWFDVHASRVGGAGSRRVAAVFNNITERKRAEANLRLLSEVSEDLVRLTDPGVTLRALCAKLGPYFGAAVCAFSPVDEAAGTVAVQYVWHEADARSPAGMYRLADYHSAEVQQAMRAGQPDVVHDTADLPAAVAAGLATLRIGAYVNLPFVRQGQWLFTLSLTARAPRDWRPDELDLLRELTVRIWTRLERAHAEEALRESEERFRNLVESHAQAVWETDPTGQVVRDSPSWRAHTGQTEAEWLSYGWVNGIHPDDQAYADRQWREAVAAGRDVNAEFRLKHASDGYRWTNVRATPIRDAQGRVHKWAGMNVDIHDRKRAEDARRQSEERLRLALDAAALGTWDWDLATNEVRWNARHFAQLGLAPHPGPLTPDDFTRYVHPDDRPEVLRRLQAAVDDNHLFEAEFRVLTAQDELRWMSGHGQPSDIAPSGRVRHMSGVLLDVTEQKHAEQHLQALAAALERKVQRRTQALHESRDLLQSVYDTTLIGMALLHAVRDEASGAIEDFTFKSANQELARMTGQPDLVGRRLTQQFPGMVPSGVLALMGEAVESGQPQQTELFYPYDGLHRWLAVMFVKLDGGVVATILDITERKTAEQQLLRNLHLLEQAETVAQLGSWDYDLATGQFYWSGGMYDLFGLPLGQPIQPPIYLDYVLDEDRPQAKQLVQQITAGVGDFETILRLRVGDAVKTVRIKVVVLRNAQGQAVRVLGVDLDISALQRLEADNLRLRLSQQQALFEAVQAAEEEERRRMSESLHNGIGQILYATKLQLDCLPPAPASSPSQEAARLLGEAIRQTRTLSHELTPAILEDYGLEKTLQSMCSSLNGAGLHWRCYFSFDEGSALPMPLQLAVYRLAQELAQNVLKHAHATHATLEVDVLPAWVVLRVEDNGRGFDLAQISDGLGLRSTRSRAALLGGSVHLTTTPGQGTQCQIRIPLSSPTS